MYIVESMYLSVAIILSNKMVFVKYYCAMRDIIANALSKLLGVDIALVLLYYVCNTDFIKREHAETKS